MDIRLLGPFEVWRGSSRVALGAPKQQALLAQLALRVGAVVPSEVLIEGLWPTHPPRTAAKSIQVYVSNLRRALGPRSIATIGAGYRLAVDARDIDVIRFEHLVAGARVDLAAGRSDAAATSLREGLALWRGAALETFHDEAFAAGPIAALDELRTTAAETLFRAELELGRGSAILADVQAAVQDEPLHEGLRAVLMRALYQSGRQADALAAYQEMRRTLEEELGLDPSPELQELERSILLQDPRLGKVSRAVPPASREAERKLASVVIAIPDGEPPGDPEQQLIWLDRFRTVVTAEIERAGGSAEGLADGSIRGIFGAPIALEDHADRALEALTRARDRLMAELHRGHGLRGAVETGEVVVARSSASGILVVGEPTSRAPRLATVAGSGAILAGDRSVDSSTRFAFGNEAVVGLEQGHIAFRPVVGGSAPVGARTALVGRRRELNELAAESSSALVRGTPTVVVLIGDAGVGKTRLAEALATRLARGGAGPQAIFGRCASYGEARTYRPAAEMLRTLLDIRDGDSTPDVLRALGDRPILALTLGLDVASEAHPFTAVQQLQVAWANLLTERVASRPLVLVFEDLHWADDPLLDLIDRLAGLVRGPLLILATARPEFADRWEAWGAAKQGFSAHWLEPLPMVDAERLVRLRSGRGVPASVAAAIAQRAEGNPFFIEELVGSLLDSGRPQGLAPGAESGASSPDSIYATVAARIDLLPLEAKTALQAAAVIGREFASEALEGVLRSVGRPSSIWSTSSFGSTLRILEARDFLREHPDAAVVGEVVLWFKHAITRDVAFGTLPAARRGTLHEAFVRWLLRRHGGRDEDAPVLGHHLSAAANARRLAPDDDPDPAATAELAGEAVRWLERAAELAIGRYELDSAERLLRDALALTTDRDTQARLWRSLAEIGSLRYDGEGFWAAMHQAIELAEDGAAQAELYGLLAEVTALRLGMWLRAPRQSLIDGWIDHALALASPRSLGRARALVARAWMSATFGDDLDRQADIGEVRAVAEALHDSQLLAHALGVEVRHELFRGDYGLAETNTRHLIALADDINNPDEEALILQQGVTFLLTLGALGEAARLARRFEALTARLSPHHRVHSAAAEILVRYLGGSHADVLAMAPIVRQRMAESLSTPCFSGPFSLLMCANAALRTGDDAAADGLEDDVAAAMMEGYGLERDPLRIRASVLRGDFAATRALMTTSLRDLWDANWLSAVVPEYIDGLIAVAEPDRIRAEVERFLTPGTVFVPFARRALAIVAGDAEGVRAADAELIARGLTTAAADTPRLVAVYAGRQPPASRPVRVPSPGDRR
jgi:DNA-binding SARP family transcriptional activator